MKLITKLYNYRIVFNYALFGIVFGFFFPLIAITISLYLHKTIFISDLGLMTAIIEIHYSSPLNYIIDTAPLFLGLAFYIAGLKQHKLVEYNKNLEQTVETKTKDLTTANTQLLGQSKKIEKLYKELSDNITYAKRIQRSILYTNNLLQQTVQNYFIINNPRDLISGDFYWSFQPNDEEFFISLGDCTGHGVSGGILTIIAKNCLENVVKNRYNQTPSQILDILDEYFIDTLYGSNYQEKEDFTHIHDGFDIAIVKINYRSKKLMFSGAKRPIYLIQDGILNEYKGSAHSIGYKKKYDNEIFKDIELCFKPSDLLYLTSDGFPDQFDKTNSKRIKNSNLKKILTHISRKNMETQKKYLEVFLQKWIGNTRQTDDILLMGLKLD